MNTARALVADSDPVARLAIDRQLEVLGWDALLVNTGLEVLRILQQPPLDIDVLLINVRLPDLSGIEVAAMARDLRPRLRVVFMCDVTPHPEVGRPLLVKPFSSAALARAVAADAQPR